jgi:hypothetical protein
MKYKLCKGLQKIINLENGIEVARYWKSDKLVRNEKDEHIYPWKISSGDLTWIYETYEEMLVHLEKIVEELNA